MGEAEEERRARAFVVRTLGTAFYYRARGPLSALLREPFLGSCVLTGGFSALALNAPSDQGNSFAILPGGVLVLSLDRESFQARNDDLEAVPVKKQPSHYFDIARRTAFRRNTPLWNAPLAVTSFKALPPNPQVLSIAVAHHTAD